MLSLASNVKLGNCPKKINSCEPQCILMLTFTIQLAWLPLLCGLFVASPTQWLRQSTESWWRSQNCLYVFLSSFADFPRFRLSLMTLFLCPPPPPSLCIEFLERDDYQLELVLSAELQIPSTGDVRTSASTMGSFIWNDINGLSENSPMWIIAQHPKNPDFAVTLCPVMLDDSVMHWFVSNLRCPHLQHNTFWTIQENLKQCAHYKQYRQLLLSCKAGQVQLFIRITMQLQVIRILLNSKYSFQQETSLAAFASLFQPFWGYSLLRVVP